MLFIDDYDCGPHEKDDRRKLEEEIKVLKEKLEAQRKSSTGVLATLS